MVRFGFVCLSVVWLIKLTSDFNQLNFQKQTKWNPYKLFYSKSFLTGFSIPVFQVSAFLLWNHPPVTALSYNYEVSFPYVVVDYSRTFLCKLCKSSGQLGSTSLQLELFAFWVVLCVNLHYFPIWILRRGLGSDKRFIYHQHAEELKGSVLNRIFSPQIIFLAHLTCSELASENT